MVPFRMERYIYLLDKLGFPQAPTHSGRFHFQKLKKIHFLKVEMKMEQINRLLYYSVKPEILFR
jgi:hypothetical protein